MFLGALIYGWVNALEGPTVSTGKFEGCSFGAFIVHFVLLVTARRDPVVPSGGGFVIAEKTSQFGKTVAHSRCLGEG